MAAAFYTGIFFYVVGIIAMTGIYFIEKSLRK
jgi:hypothetical protein